MQEHNWPKCDCHRDPSLDSRRYWMTRHNAGAPLSRDALAALPLCSPGIGRALYARDTLIDGNLAAARCREKMAVTKAALKGQEMAIGGDVTKFSSHERSYSQFATLRSSARECRNYYLGQSKGKKLDFGGLGIALELRSKY